MTPLKEIAKLVQQMRDDVAEAQRIVNRAILFLWVIFIVWVGLLIAAMVMTK